MIISNDTLNILAECSVVDNKVFLPNRQLDRILYVSVDKVLKSMGGKWNRGAKAHVFSDNPANALEAVVQTGEYTDKKREFQFFETPAALADRLVELAQLCSAVRREPSR